MTARARRMLAALEDGCSTRAQLYAHVGSYFLCNNGAAELRASGVPVVCVRLDGDYVYSLADGPLSGPARVAPTLPVDSVAIAITSGPLNAPTLSTTTGQLFFAVAT